MIYISFHISAIDYFVCDLQIVIPSGFFIAITTQTYSFLAISLWIFFFQCIMRP